MDKKSVDYQRISEKAQKVMAAYGDPFHPAFCCLFAPEDLVILNQVEQVYYIPAKVGIGCLPSTEKHLE